MSREFDQKMHATLGDARLQLAIYTATGRFKEARANIVAADVLPDYQELRTQANAVKQHAIDHLDYYLEQFQRSVEDRGGHVAYAKDATEVADFVLSLAKARGARLIVKSKSMTTEEVDLNERLERHGLESVETDFGEYILQLAHERPYHIVAPALHKTRYFDPNKSLCQALKDRLGFVCNLAHDVARRLCFRHEADALSSPQ